MNGNSGGGTGFGTGSETGVGVSGIFLDCFGCSVGWISSLGTQTILSTFMLPICCCIGGGLYTFGSPFSSKKSASSGIAASGVAAA